MQTKAFLYIPYVDIEPADCLERYYNCIMIEKVAIFYLMIDLYRCVDYIAIDRHPFGVYDVCGNDSEPFFIESSEC